MTIRVVRNEQGNCVNFVGSTQPAYWNACLTAEAAPESATQINIRNDNRSVDLSSPIYEFFRIEYTEFQDRDGVAFADRQAAIDYINGAARVTGVSSYDTVGIDLNGVDVCFSLDATSTSILLDVGFSYGVNTIKAIPHTDGTIHIHTKLGDRTLFSGLAVGSACKTDGSVIPGGLNDVANYLNELFTVGPFEAVVISDPYSTIIADVSGVAAGYTLEGTDAIDPIGTDIFGVAAPSFEAGLKSISTIDQAGEYFTFDIRGAGQIGFGLIHSDASYAANHWQGSYLFGNPSRFASSIGGEWGFQFSHWFNPTYNGSWANYGADTTSVAGPGSTSWDQLDEWLAGSPVKIRVGIDANGYISIESLQDDSTWVVHSRTSYAVPEGAEFHLGVKTYAEAARVYSAPKVHLLEPAAPTLYARYIESPDGVFQYPLFATEDEANYYDLESGGTGAGSSHSHTYEDDPTGTTWYMPDNGGTMAASSAPVDQGFAGQYLNYTEITSLTNSDLIPEAFSGDDVTQQEGLSVNISTQPSGVGYTTTITGLPTGLTATAGLIQGTLPEVGSDTPYTITVTRANSYGSSQGTFVLTITNEDPSTSNDTPWTKALDFSGSGEHAKQASGDSLAIPVRMAGTNQYVSAPTAGQTVTSGHPWATAVFFKSNGFTGNAQKIWNVGEGNLDDDDNIYVRQAVDGNMYFGWGRIEGGERNECLIGTGFNSSGQQWHGLYIAHNGARFSASDATPANLAAAFDIRWYRINYTSGNIELVTNAETPDGNSSTVARWTSGNTGARMNRAISGDMFIGGVHSTYNFHGKIASFVSTTLRQGVAMPDDAESLLMVTDPIQWLNNYKVGQLFRYAGGTNETDTFAIGNSYSGYATQVWLMGDGANDSYSNMIRNRVQPNDQNYTKLNMISMVSNDIETVSIPGLN